MKSVFALLALVGLSQTGMGAVLVAYNGGFAAPSSTAAGVTAGAINPAPTVNGNTTIALAYQNAWYVSAPMRSASRNDSAPTGVAFLRVGDAGIVDFDLASSAMSIARGQLEREGGHHREREGRAAPHPRREAADGRCGRSDRPRLPRACRPGVPG